MIVRELITKLGFQFDRSNLDKFERSVIGFKTKIAIASTSIGLAFKKLTDAASNFSDNLIKTDALAKFSKVPAEIIDGMQNAFAKFDIPNETFTRIFEDISVGIKQASKGVQSPFLELVKQSQGAVRLYVDGQLTTTKLAFDDIMNYVRKLSDESEKLRIIENIFGVDLTTANNLSNVFKLTNDELDALIKKEGRSAEEIEKSRENAIKFKQSINSLSVEWDKLTNRIIQSTVGPLADFFGSINKFIDDSKAKGFLKTITENAANNEENLYRQSLGYVPEHIRNRNKGIDSSSTSQESYSDSKNTIVNNNSFEFNVPPGTPEEQAQFQADQVVKAMETLWNQKTREVFNNNPQVE